MPLYTSHKQPPPRPITRIFPSHAACYLLHAPLPIGRLTVLSPTFRGRRVEVFSFATSELEYPKYLDALLVPLMLHMSSFITFIFIFAFPLSYTCNYSVHW